jgi:LacI family transcriptional regulator
MSKKSLSSRLPKVLVACETWWGNGRKMIDGIVRYADQHARWEFLHGTTPQLQPHTIKHFAEADGIIAEAWRSEILEAVYEAGKPAVVIRSGEAPGLPRVADDHCAIARMAFEHFRDRGYTHYGYCGSLGISWARQRYETYRGCVESVGHQCHAYQGDLSWIDPDDWEALVERLARWVSDVPKPIGIFAANAHLARVVASACCQADVLVPEELALLGVGNDRIICNLTTPPLSVVNSNATGAGYEAAAMLDRLLAGQSLSDEAVLMPPRVAIVRRSTDTLAISDPDIAAAVRMIREHACEGVGVPDVLDVVPASRRKLERSFKRLLGRTVHQEILRVRVQRARELLAETDMTMAQITARTGFEYATHLTAVFRKLTGQTPSEYRRMLRQGATE